MTEYEASLAAVNGVVIPVPQASYEEPLELSDNPLNIERQANYLCPLCGAEFSQKYEIGPHFVTCVRRNGNPDGVCWDDSLGDTGQMTALQQPQQVIKYSAAPQHGLWGHSEVQKRFYERLNPVNGVAIPSKLRAGESPVKFISRANNLTPRPFLCPICKGSFAKRDGVKSHFVACVEQNGNPDGVRFDHAFPVPKCATRPRKLLYKRLDG